MDPILGHIIVIAALAAAVGLAGRSLWHARRSGGCDGSCGHCQGCRAKRFKGR